MAEQLIATKGFLLTGTFVVDGLGDEVLAGAALTLNQNGGGLAGRNLTDKIHELDHLGRDAYHAVIAGFAAYLTSQGLHFGTQARSLERILDGDVEFIEIDRLAHEVVGPEFECGFDIVKLRIGSDHDDGAGIAAFLELIQHLDAGKVGHTDVEQDEIRRFTLRQLETGLPGIGLDYVIAPLLALLAQRPAHQALVVHNHDFLCWHRVFNLLRNGRGLLWRRRRRDRVREAAIFEAVGHAETGHEMHSKLASLPDHAADFDTAMMFFHNAAGERQAQAGAVALGGVERPEDICQYAEEEYRDRYR